MDRLQTGRLNLVDSASSTPVPASNSQENQTILARSTLDPIMGIILKSTSGFQSEMTSMNNFNSCKARRVCFLHETKQHARHNACGIIACVSMPSSTIKEQLESTMPRSWRVSGCKSKTSLPRRGVRLSRTLQNSRRRTSHMRCKDRATWQESTG